MARPNRVYIARTAAGTILGVFAERQAADARVKDAEAQGVEARVDVHEVEQ